MLSALVIDEAQSIPHELLEEIRLLSNIETTTTKLLNVILAGQPELSDRLNETSLRQLKQRIGLRCQLAPMQLNETASYIAGRIRIAGGRPEQVFTREAVAAVFRPREGCRAPLTLYRITRSIGGFAAQVKPINAKFVEEVCRDFDINAAVGSAAVISSLEEMGGGEAPAVGTKGHIWCRRRKRPRSVTRGSAGGGVVSDAHVRRRQPEAGIFVFLITTRVQGHAQVILTAFSLCAGSRGPSSSGALFATLFVLPAVAQTAATAQRPWRAAATGGLRWRFRRSTSSVPRTCWASTSGATPT